MPYKHACKSLPRPSCSSAGEGIPQLKVRAPLPGRLHAQADKEKELVAMLSRSDLTVTASLMFEAAYEEHGCTVAGSVRELLEDMARVVVQIV